MRSPDLRLHCFTDACNGIRFFARAGDGPYLSKEKTINCFVSYWCRNCQKTEKVYAIAISLDVNETHGTMFKFGETPPFGPPTPARVISLIGPDRNYFLKGRRAENQALGIAAFAYYRRVVENQKNRILDEIIRVAEKLSAPQELIDELRNAQNETQFSKAISLIKHGIPQILLINGHNPLTLLHSALSGGLHDQSDEECLTLATSIRVIMTELAERLGQALKDEAELNTAVSKLLSASSQKQRKQSSSS